jgi:hypothetical protein
MADLEKEKTTFKAGMYLLETLTSGMYNEPLTIYREYIQNAVDSIDLKKEKKKRFQGKINIRIDPFERKITISDNGLGIPENNFDSILNSIGSSMKTKEGLRGFRGIGRLGGIGFCDKLVFVAKAEGETVESVQEWDCIKLKRYLSQDKKKNMSLRQLFEVSTREYLNNSKRSLNSYFEVILEGVSSFRNQIFDIDKIRNYLEEVLPLPFNKEDFSHAQAINKFMSGKVKTYSAYKILLNGEQLFKPYCDRIKVTKKGYDYIDDVSFFDLEVKGEEVAHGWCGKRRELLGGISKGNRVSGIRVRVGNILIGDQHLLDNCFKEPRFNSYVLGEIHVDTKQLIPNSRRDDFVDSDAKTIFYNEIERNIGLPISKEIRFKSKLNSKRRAQENMILNGSTDIEKDSRRLLLEEMNRGETSTPKKIVHFESSNGNPASVSQYILKHPSAEMILDEIMKRCGECLVIEEILPGYSSNN